MPDKAFDIVDHAAAKCKIESFKRPAEAKELERKIDVLMNDPDSVEAFQVKEEPEQLFSDYKRVMAQWSAEMDVATVEVTPTYLYQVISEKLRLPWVSLPSQIARNYLTSRSS